MNLSNFSYFTAFYFKQGWVFSVNFLQEIAESREPCSSCNWGNVIFTELLKGVYANRNPNSDGNCEGHGHLFTYLPMQHYIQIKNITLFW